MSGGTEREGASTGHPWPTMPPEQAVEAVVVWLDERQARARPMTAMYTDDVEHDVVGSPTGPLKGKDAAQGFDEYLTQNVHQREDGADAQLLRRGLLCDRAPDDGNSRQ